MKALSHGIDSVVMKSKLRRSGRLSIVLSCSFVEKNGQRRMPIVVHIDGVDPKVEGEGVENAYRSLHAILGALV